MKNLLHIVEEFFGVYRWHPKIALRYLPIVDEIRKRKIVNPTILEIGSGPLGIAPYIKQEVIGLDIDFTGPSITYLKKKEGSALQVPFPNSSFDFVVMMDVLEHIAPKDRQRAIIEGLRVARQELVIGVPCGQKSAQQDKQLADIYEKIHKKPFHFCCEHITFGLPSEDDIKQKIDAAAKKIHCSYSLIVMGNINLTVRQFLMYGWMTKNVLIDVFFRKILLIFIPLLRHLNHKPTYRRLFFVYKNAHGKV